MSFERYMASRLRLTGKGGSTPAGILVAVLGISLSLIIMMAALCIVTGFKHEIRRKVMGFDAQVTILPADNESRDDGICSAIPSLRLSPALTAIIDSTHLFSTPQLVMGYPAVLKTDEDFQGVIMRGIDSGQGADFIRNALSAGEWWQPDDTGNPIIISQNMADRLLLSVGDKVFGYFFTAEGVRTRRLTVSAIYNTHFSDYDNSYVYAPLDLLQGVAGLDSLGGNRIDLYLSDKNGDIETAALILQQDMMRKAWTGELEGMYRISTVTSSGMMYFNWLALLDTNVVVILVLMALVSAFTLVASLFIIILERVRMIGLLKALGATNRSVNRIFTLLGYRLIFAGMIIGNIAGLLLMWIQQCFHIIPLDPEAYYLDFVPVEINPLHIILLNAGVFIIAWAVLLIPGRLIASISPAKSMRYE